MSTGLFGVVTGVAIGLTLTVVLGNVDCTIVSVGITITKLDVVSVVRGTSIFGIGSTVVGGLVVSMGRTSIGCAIVPVGTIATDSSTVGEGGMVTGAI